MSQQLVYGIVRESARRVIHVVRVQGRILDPAKLEDIAERMRERLASRGEVVAEVVMVQGAGKETLRLFGNPYSVSKVRAAMFNAQLSWAPIELD
jgi:translation initiation factor 1 (eIF-1/SUI1)